MLNENRPRGDFFASPFFLVEGGFFLLLYNPIRCSYSGWCDNISSWNAWCSLRSLELTRRSCASLSLHETDNGSAGSPVLDTVIDHFTVRRVKAVPQRRHLHNLPWQRSGQRKMQWIGDASLNPQYEEKCSDLAQAIAKNDVLQIKTWMCWCGRITFRNQ